MFGWNFSNLSATAEQEEITRHPLPIFSFSGEPDNKDGSPALCLAETFYCNIV